MSGVPQLSVVIPTHDTRELVLRCLESLDFVAPEAGGLEIIVVDDGSSDGSGEAIRRRYPSIRQLRHESALGFAKAANAGLEAARGEGMLLLNSDTRVPPGSLRALSSRLFDAPALEIIGAQLLNADGSSQWSGGSFPTALWLFALISGAGELRSRVFGPREHRGEEPRKVDWVSGAAMAFRRELRQRIGPLDEGFAFYGQDLDFCFRAQRDGIGSVLLPAFRVIHEHGGTVRSRPGAVALMEPEKLWPDLLRFFEMHFSSAETRRVCRIMRVAAGLRLSLRRMICPFLRHGQRESFREDTERFRRAAARLSRNAASP